MIGHLYTLLFDEEPTPPASAGRSQYLRQQLIEIYEKEWAEKKAKDEKLREEELSAQKAATEPVALAPIVEVLTPAPKKVRVKAPPPEDQKTTPLPVSSETEPEVLIAEIVSSALKGMRTAPRRKGKPVSVPARRQKDAEEEELILTFLAQWVGSQLEEETS